MYNSGNLDSQVRKIQEIKKRSSLKEYKGFLIPYLYNGNLFPNTRDEFRKEMEDFLDEDELEAVCEEERPEVLEHEWNGFKLTYLLHWNILFPDVKNSDFLPKKMVYSFENELLSIATNNLSKINFKITDLVKDKDEISQIYSISYGTGTVPEFSPSILLDKKALKSIYEYIGEEFYIIPFYKGAVFAIKKGLFGKIGKEEVLKIIENTSSEHHEEFSTRVFEYDGKELKETP